MKSTNVAWLVVALTVLVHSETVAQNKSLCMSDDELYAFLREGGMYLLGAAGATCCKRDASPRAACSKVTQEVQKFEKTAEQHLRINRDKALAPFRRSFGAAQAETMFATYSAGMETRLREVVKKYDQQQCSSWLSAIEIFSRHDEKKLGDIIKSVLVTPAEFAAERPRVPKC